MKDKLVKQKNVLYYIAIFMIFIIGNNNTSSILNLDPIFRQMMYGIAVILLGIKILCDKHSLKEYILMGILGLVFLYTSIKVDNIFFIVNYILIISISDIKISEIVKIDIIVKMTFLLVNSTIYYIDVLTNQIPFEERQTLYFHNPNTTMGVIFWLIVDFIILSKDNYRKVMKTSTIGLILMFVAYWITGSRTAMYLYIILYILIILAYILRNKNIKVIKKISKYAIDVLFITSLIICLFYPKLNLQEVNAALSGRLYKSYWAYNKFGFNIVAGETLDEIVDNVILDNFYTRSIVCYGIIIYLILSIWIKKFSKKNDSKVLDMIVIVFCLFLFNESYPYLISRCIIPLMIGQKALLGKKEGEAQSESKKFI